MDTPEINWRRAIGVLLAVMALSVVGLAFLGSQTERILSTVGASVGAPGQAADPESEQGDVPADDAEGGDPDDDGDDAEGIAAFQDAGRPDLLVIRRGAITIKVGDIDAALADAGEAIASLGGYESGSRRSGRGDEAQAEVVYRFPASSWQVALVAIRAVGAEVLHEESETTDVSAEVVDLDARIRNLRVAEAALQAIMDRATVIEDVLDVQSRLTSVRGEIEQLSSKAAYLREQAAMSTLSVVFVLPETPVIARQEARFDPGQETEAATASLVAMLQSVAVAGIWFGIVWLPVLIALAVVAGVTVLIVRRVRNVAVS